MLRAHSFRRPSVRRSALVTIAVLLGLAVSVPASAPSARSASPSAVAPAAAAAGAPNIFFYNLDDLRDAFPGAIDPLQLMPKTRAWMAASGRRYTQTFVADPSCCPSRSALMTGRYPHNNGVLDQQDGPLFDGPHSMACYLRSAGYATYLDGKFLTTWPKTTLPPCFDHSTVMWGGYTNVQVRVDGVSRTASGYSTTYLGNQGRTYITQALAGTKPFLLYETPQAPHWVDTTVNGSPAKLAVPDTQYANANVGTCSGVPEADRSDKPAYVRTMNFSTAKAQQLCQSQLRAIMSADDQFAATMQLLSDRGVLDNTLVIFSSDNGYNWGEHGRWEKFVPYEPSIRVPLWVRWPGHIAAGTDTTRQTSYLDLLPTMLEAAGFTLPTGAPRLDGESLLQAGRRTTMYSEYYVDTANPKIPSWRMVRTATAKYVQTYDAQGAVIAREYYNLTNDPAENLNLLGDSSTANNPPASTITAMTNQLNAFATCGGPACVK